MKKFIVFHIKNTNDSVRVMCLIDDNIRNGYWVRLHYNPHKKCSRKEVLTALRCISSEFIETSTLKITNCLIDFLEQIYTGKIFSIYER